MPINEQFYDHLTKSWKRSESLEKLEETTMNEQFDDLLRTCTKRKESLEIEIPMENREERGGSGITHHMEETSPLSPNTMCNERDMKAETRDTAPPFEQVVIHEASSNRNGIYWIVILCKIRAEPRLHGKISRESKECKNLRKNENENE